MRVNGTTIPRYGLWQGGWGVVRTVFGGARTNRKSRAMGCAVRSAVARSLARTSVTNEYVSSWRSKSAGRRMVLPVVIRTKIHDDRELIDDFELDQNESLYPACTRNNNVPPVTL